jgi:hypothetical protein
MKYYSDSSVLQSSRTWGLQSKIPGPDLADQDDVMEKEVWEASKSNGISKSTRARAGRNPVKATVYPNRLAPGQAAM